MRVAIPLAGAALAAAALIAGCSTDSQPAPTSIGTETAPPTDTPPADPPLGVDFPDLSGYTESFDQFEQTDVPRVQGFSFSTPSGLVCSSNAYPEPQFESVSCRGPIAAQGPGLWEVTTLFGQAATVAAVVDDGLPQHDPPVLPPFHKVTASKGAAECGVDDEGTVACRIGQDGFVLTPSSVELF